MRKGIEWLKGLINEEGIVIDMNLLGRFDKQYWKNENIKINKGRLFYLIDQLDEPETLSEEWIENHTASADTISYYSDENVPVVTVEKLKNLLVPKQDKPVIPEFVADWIDAHNLHGNNPLREYRDLENDFNEGWTDEKDAEVYHWVNKNPYAFIDALRYGYEVEKEILWEIPMPDLKTSDGHIQYLTYDPKVKAYFTGRKKGRSRRYAELCDFEKIEEVTEMRKDKAWLKEEIWKQDIVMNKGYIYTDDLMSIINEVDEPEKPVIPQFVADYIGWFKRDYEREFSADAELIIFLLQPPFEYETSKRRKVKEWIDKSGNAIKMLDAYRYGYEVEKEKMYYVYDSTTDSYLGFNGDRTNLGWYYYTVNKESFTEDEIKAIDERYWAFAQEVTE